MTDVIFDGCAGCDKCRFSDPDIPSDVHEIHITVRSVGNNYGFREICKHHGIKAIVIAYESDATVMLDPMTSCGFRGTCEGALEEAKRVSDILVAGGFEVLRTKIETSPTNPVISDTDGYFESHLAVLVPSVYEDEFRKLIDDFSFGDDTPVHVSRNAFKSNGDDKTIMVTHRRYNNDTEAFIAETQQLRDTIRGGVFHVDQPITEYCWHDSNRAHDVLWMGRR